MARLAVAVAVLPWPRATGTTASGRKVAVNFKLRSSGLAASLTAASPPPLGPPMAGPGWPLEGTLRDSGVTLSLPVANSVRGTGGGGRGTLRV